MELNQIHKFEADGLDRWKTDIELALKHGNECDLVGFDFAWDGAFCTELARRCRMAFRLRNENGVWRGMFRRE